MVWLFGGVIISFQFNFCLNMYIVCFILYEQFDYLLVVNIWLHMLSSTLVNFLHFHDYVVAKILIF